jgi:hypothetical protein
MKNLSKNSPNPKWKQWTENIKLLAETFNNIMPIIKVIASIAGVFMLVVFIQGQFKSNDIDKYIAEAKKFQADAQMAVAFADSLKAEVKVLELDAAEAIGRANRLGGQVATLRGETRELRNQLAATIAASPPITDMSNEELVVYASTIIPQQAQVIEAQDIIINVQTAQVEELERALVFKDQTILLLTQSADSLEFVLRNTPTIPKNPNKFLGINLPSRTTSFVAGAVTATIAIVVLSK